MTYYAVRVVDCKANRYNDTIGNIEASFTSGDDAKRYAEAINGKLSRQASTDAIMVYSSNDDTFTKWEPCRITDDGTIAPFKTIRAAITAA